MEKYLQEQLSRYNCASNNAYKLKWGTSLDFVNDNYTAINGKVLTPAQVFTLKLDQSKQQAADKNFSLQQLHSAASSEGEVESCYQQNDGFSIQHTLKQRLALYNQSS